VRRVAIVDIDVHHGNGTQDVLARLSHADWAALSASGGAERSGGGGAPTSGWAPFRKDVFFTSLHLHDQDDALDVGEYAFYPGSGKCEPADLFSNALNVPVAPLWTGGRPTAAAARRAAAASAAGSPPAATAAADAAAAAAPPLPTERSDKSFVSAAPVAPAAPAAPAASRPGRKPHDRTEPMALPCGRAQYREVFATRVLPALRAAAPDLILVSAGFDAGKRDVGNSRLFSDDRYCQGLDLEPHDFSWLTEQLVSVANQVCGGRIVSVLEGGYGHYETEAGELAICPTSLADNCVAHVRALVGRPMTSAAVNRPHSRVGN
jgi:acetoin utilization deacetylase AcuC-like enzyme